MNLLNLIGIEVKRAVIGKRDEDKKDTFRAAFAQMRGTMPTKVSAKRAHWVSQRQSIRCATPLRADQKRTKKIAQFYHSKDSFNARRMLFREKKGILLSKS